MCTMSGDRQPGSNGISCCLDLLMAYIAGRVVPAAGGGSWGLYAVIAYIAYNSTEADSPRMQGMGVHHAVVTLSSADRPVHGED